MGQELTTAATGNKVLQNIEENLLMLTPRFEALLDGSSVKSQFLIQTLLISCQRNDKLIKCSLPSLIAGALTFATLRLPIDGVSGQGFLLPFAGVATPAIGYKGYNTIAGRSAISINAGTVRKGDDIWDFMEGTGGFVKHKRRLGNRGEIIAFWAVAEGRDRPPLVSVLGIDQVNDIMAKSPAVKAGADTPWNDAKIGFPAMGEKSARRRLARGMPWEVDNGRFLMAAAMEETFEERGKVAYLNGPVLQVEGEENRIIGPATVSQQTKQPSTADLTSPRPSDHEKNLQAAGDKAAAAGTNALKTWFLALDARDKRLVESYKDGTLKKAAEGKDNADIAAFDAGSKP